MDIDSLYNQATQKSKRTDISPDRRKRINRLWTAVHSGVDTTDAAAFGTHLQRTITRLYQEAEADEARAVLCGEGNLRCNCLFGKVPIELQPRASPLGGTPEPTTPDDASRYLASHSKCHAVRTALEEWEAERQATKRALQLIISIASAKGAADIDVDEGNIPAVGEEA